MEPERREGRCAWCEREGQRLSFLIWYMNDDLFTDWVCEHCRRAVGATVNESED